MDDTFVKIMLAAMASAISALWYRQGTTQAKLDELIRKEATCQTKLDLLQMTLEEKHEENQQALAALYCKRMPE